LWKSPAGCRVVRCPVVHDPHGDPDIDDAHDDEHHIHSHDVHEDGHLDSHDDLHRQQHQELHNGLLIALVLGRSSDSANLHCHDGDFHHIDGHNRNHPVFHNV